MSTALHQEALIAFQGSDSLVTGFQSKITSYQKQQKEDHKAKTDRYDWITAQRSLRENEAVATKQISHVCSRVLELLQEEEWHEELCIDPRSRADAIESLKDVIAATTRPAETIAFEQQLDMSRVFRDITRKKNKPDSEVNVNDRTVASLKDLRATLATSVGDLDKIFAVQSDEVSRHRREVMSIASIGDNDNKQLPVSVSRALDSLRTLLKENHTDDEGEIDVLEQGLREKLERAHSEHNTLLDDEFLPPHSSWDEKSKLILKTAFNSSTGLMSSACLVNRLKKELPGKSEPEIIACIEYRKAQKRNKLKLKAAAEDQKRKCRIIESDGLKMIDHLIEKYNSRLRTSRIQVENDMKRKELSIKLKALRVEREEIQSKNAARELKALSKKNGDGCRKDLHRAQIMLKNTQAIIQHQAQQFNHRENSTDEFKNEFAVEIEALKRQDCNRRRSDFREAQINNKRIEQKKAEEELCIAEKARVARLNNLATNVPYFNSIMEKTSDIHKTTQARKNDVYEGRSKLADFQCGNLKSFSNERCFSDPKFRLGNALHESGVARSAYARDVVREVIPRSEERTTGIKPY